MTVTDLLRRGQRIAVNCGSAPVETLKLLRCTGTYPYTATVRPVTWLDRLWSRITAPLRRLRRAVREWRLSRCDVWWCWRREAVVDEGWCGWCRVHEAGKAVRYET